MAERKIPTIFVGGRLTYSRKDNIFTTAPLTPPSEATKHHETRTANGKGKDTEDGILDYYLAKH